VKFIRGILVVVILVFGSHVSVSMDSVRRQEWIIAALRLSTAHKISKGAGITVALIDTGVSATNADLTGNILSGTDLSRGVPEGDGLSDVDGHGTAMASIIAGHGHGHGDGDGVLGIAPNAKILPIRNGEHNSVYLAIAIDWAVQNGARVISISTGQGGTDSGLVAAVKRAIAADVVVVAAVGDQPRDKQVLFPAALPGVLAVGGTDRQGNRATLSVVGPEVLILAPAIDIVSDSYNGEYVNVSGTSASTAIVAGAAALVMSRFPKLSASQVIRRLELTALDKGSKGRDSSYGYGLLDIEAALTVDAPSVTISMPSSNVQSTPKRNYPSNTIASTEMVRQMANDNLLPMMTELLVALALLVIGITLFRLKRLRDS